jgi:CheY-specific phosphatase CheX
MSTSTGLDFVRAFGQAAEQVLQEVLSETPTRGAPTFQMGPTIPLQEVNVQVGITGELTGHVNFGMNMYTAKAIAGIMMMEEVEELDDMAISALSSVLMGASISGTWAHVRAMSVPLALGAGTLHLTVGIRAKESK